MASGSPWAGPPVRPWRCRRPRLRTDRRRLRRWPLERSPEVHWNQPPPSPRSPPDDRTIAEANFHRGEHHASQQAGDEQSEVRAEIAVDHRGRAVGVGGDADAVHPAACGPRSDQIEIALCNQALVDIVPGPGAPRERGWKALDPLAEPIQHDAAVRRGHLYSLGAVRGLLHRAAFRVAPRRCHGQSPGPPNRRLTSPPVMLSAPRRSSSPSRLPLARCSARGSPRLRSQRFPSALRRRSSQWVCRRCSLSRSRAGRLKEGRGQPQRAPRQCSLGPRWVSHAAPVRPNRLRRLGAGLLHPVRERDMATPRVVSKKRNADPARRPGGCSAGGHQLAQHHPQGAAVAVVVECRSRGRGGRWSRS